MCVAIFKPKDRSIPLPVLEHCWDTNPHGGGFALPDGAGGVTIHKALDWEEFVTLWDRYADAAAPMLVHFRLATHGIVNLENCHPHRIAPGLAMVHNGIYRKKVPYTTPPRSDTVQLVRGVLRHMRPEDVTSPRGICLIKAQDYGWSRTALLDGNGKHFIIREQKGEWIGGCWYSKKHWDLGLAALKRASTHPRQRTPPTAGKSPAPATARRQPNKAAPSLEPEEKPTKRRRKQMVPLKRQPQKPMPEDSETSEQYGYKLVYDSDRAAYTGNVRGSPLRSDQKIRPGSRTQPR